MKDLMRGWELFIDRSNGQLHLRFLIQVAVGIMIALIVGLKDARAGNSLIYG